MPHPSIFTRARQMVAQSPHPTTLEAQLSKLARRRRKPVLTIVAPPKSQTPAWMLRADLQ